MPAFKASLAALWQTVIAVAVKTYQTGKQKLTAQTIRFKEILVNTWQKLPPSKYVRGGVVAAIALVALSLPALAIFGGGESSPLKLPDDKPQSATVIDDKVLSVVQATPEGKISLGDERKEIFVVFSHPVVPLGTLDEVTKGAFSVTPKVKGRFRWYGSRICAFVPDEDWKQGGKYSVAVNADTVAVTGQRLKEAKSFSFRMEVPDLRVENVSAQSYGKIKYDEEFSITLNFAVAQTALADKLRLLQNGSAVGYDLKQFAETDYRGRRKKKDGRTWRIVPRERLAKAAKIEVIVAKGLKAKGVLTQLPDEHKTSFETYGDFTAEFEDGAKSWPERDQTRFKFSNPVNPKVAVRAIKFNPPRKAIWLPYGEVTEISISTWNVEPGKKYKITLSEFSDVMGNRLVKGGSFETELPDRDKFFQRVESGSVLEATMAQNYPLNVSNIQQLRGEVSTFSLDDVFGFVKTQDAYSLSQYMKKKSPQGKTIDFKTRIAKNQIGHTGFNLAPFLDDQRGWVFAQVYNAEDGEKARDNAVYEAIQSTDLGITARPAVGGSHVWVHSLTRAQPVAGAKVSRYTDAKHEGDCTTGNDGYCLINKGNIRESGEHVIYVASKDKDRAFVTSKEQRLSIQPTGGNFAYDLTGPQLMGVIVFDRKLHTPGDTVAYKAVLAKKQADQFSALAKESVTVEINNAEGKSIYSKSLKTSQQGGVGGEVEIPKGAPLGHYTVSISPGDEFGRQHVQDTFQIEEFRPVSFSVGVAGLSDAVAGGHLDALIDGTYLFGAPMQGARFQADVSRSKDTPRFDNYPDFVFGDQRYSYYGESEETDTGFFTGTSGRLAANGKYSMRIPLSAMAFRETIDLPEKQSLSLEYPYTLNVEATVKDVDDKSVSARRSVTVHAGKFVTGIKAKERYANTGENMQFEIIALSNAGENAGATEVKVSVLRQTWKSVRTQGPDGTLQTKNNPVRTLVATENLTASDKPVAYNFKPDKPGEYYLIVQPQGEKSFARLGFYVSGESEGFYMRNDDQVGMFADRAAYKPGDVAKIVIQSPVKTGRALITLERERVYWQRQIEIKDYAITVPVEIKQEYLPNVYLTALIVKPREEIGKRTAYQDLGAPAFKLGSMSIPVSTDSRRARLALAYDRPQYGPGDTVKISVSTEPEAEIALSVADRAVLDLVNYHFSDPVSTFFNNWALAVELFENRHAIIHQFDFSGKGGNPGGGPGEAGEGMGSGGFNLDSESGTRKNFRYTAFWKSDLRADKDGKAEITFKLPDNLSTFRIMALAAAGGKYAQHEREFRVQKALVVQPLMPRFMRAGDELEIGAVVINQTGEKGDFTVSLGADLLASGAEKTVTIGAGESKEVSFRSKLNLSKYAALLKAYREKPAELKNEKASPDPITLSGFVTARADAAKELAAKGFKADDLQDRVKFEFPVLESPSAEAFAIAGFTDKTATEAIIIPGENDVLGNLGSMDITLASTALVGLDKAFGFYSVNPYHCLEQRASAYLLAITSGELLKSFAIKPKSGDDYDFSRIEQLFIGELGEFVNSDGGLLLWKKSPIYPEKSNPYLSAYVLTVMQEAEKRNIRTNSQIRSGIVKYLDSYLKTEDKGNRHWMLESLALINLALAREGEYRKDLTKFLLKHEEHLTVRAKARVALAIAAKEKITNYKDDSDTRRLVEFFRSRLEVTTTSVMIKEIANTHVTQAFYSPNSALSLVLSVFITLDRDNPLIPQVVNHLLKNSRGYDTHSIGLMAISLDEYRSTFETSGGAFDFSGEVTLGGTRIFAQKLNSHKLDVFSKSWNMLEARKLGTPGKQLPFAFSKSGDRGRLYFTARLNYATLKAASQPRDEGIELHRNLFAIESQNGRQVERKISPEKMRRGELYVQRLMVSVPKPYYNVVIVDPLASQTEVMNAAFSTEKSGAGNAERAEEGEGGQAPEQYYFGSRPTRTEYRHDKVVMFFNYIPPGYHEYRYIIRPLVRGASVQPAGQAKLMYEPEIFGRSAARRTRVD